MHQQLWFVTYTVYVLLTLTYMFQDFHNLFNISIICVNELDHCEPKVWSTKFNHQLTGDWGTFLAMIIFESDLNSFVSCVYDLKYGGNKRACNNYHSNFSICENRWKINHEWKRKFMCETKWNKRLSGGKEKKKFFIILPKLSHLVFLS